MPVQRDTISAMACGLTTSDSSLPVTVSPLASPLASFAFFSSFSRLICSSTILIFFCISGMAPYLRSAALAKSLSLSACAALTCNPSSLFLYSLSPSTRSFSFSYLTSSGCSCSLSFSSSSLTCRNRSLF